MAVNLLGYLDAGAEVSGTDISADWGATVDGDPYLIFHEGVDESNWVIKTFLPANYASGLTVLLVAGQAGANGGDVVFEFYIDRVVTNGAALATRSWDAANSVTVTMPNVEDESEPIEKACTNDDSIQAGDVVYIKIRRNTQAAGDTAADKTRVYFIVLSYTTS